jgi:gliding motility-associated-like protein
MVARKIVILFIFSIFAGAGLVCGQGAYINMQSGIYKLTGGAGSCDRVQIPNECGPTNVLLSIAVYKDTLYYNTWTGQLRRFKIGVPGSCETLMDNSALFNSMTVDKNGVLYMASDALYRFDPHSKQLDYLGAMPFGSMGDLAFYHDKLLLAGFDPEDWSTGLYEINITDPSLSKLYMETPSFFGLLSYPVACGDNKYFGLLASGQGTTDLVELDLERKILTGNTCTMSLDVLDAASSTEMGTDNKVVITGLQINKSCQSPKGSVNVAADFPGAGEITYSLDNVRVNTSGIFDNVDPGQHLITVTAPGGVCSKDSSFTIAASYSLINSIMKANPDACANIPGHISISASSSAGALTYTLLNSGTSQPTGNFDNLRGGRYNFRISDDSGCSKDTSVALVENIPVGGCNDIFIPNAFSPNNDGKNDLYIIDLPTSFRNVTLQIYGRWGKIVCQGKGNRISWDGFYKGESQPMGIYVYSLTFTDPGGLQKVLKGTITLIR